MSSKLLNKWILLIVLLSLSITNNAFTLNITLSVDIETEGSSTISPVAASKVGSAVIFYNNTKTPSAIVSFCAAGETLWQQLPDLNGSLPAKFSLDITKTPKIEMDDMGNILVLLFPTNQKQVAILYFNYESQSWNLTNGLPKASDLDSKQASMKMAPSGQAVVALTQHSSDTLHVGTFDKTTFNWTFSTQKYPKTAFPIIAMNRHGKAIIVFNTRKYTTNLFKPKDPSRYELLFSLTVDTSATPANIGALTPIYNSTVDAAIYSKAVAISDNGQAAVLYNVNDTSFMFSLFDGTLWTPIDFDDSVPLKIPVLTMPTLSYDPSSGNIFAVYCSGTNLMTNVFNRCRWTGATVLTGSLAQMYSYSSLMDASGIGMVVWSENGEQTLLKHALFTDIKFGSSGYSSLETLATNGMNVFGAASMNGTELPNSASVFSWTIPNQTNFTHQSAFLNTFEVKQEPPPPLVIDSPANFAVKQFSNRYFSGEDLYVVLSWTAPMNVPAVLYNIYLDEKLIQQIPGDAKDFEIHNLRKGENKIAIAAIDANGKESALNTIIVQFGKKPKH